MNDSDSDNVTAASASDSTSVAPATATAVAGKSTDSVDVIPLALEKDTGRKSRFELIQEWLWPDEERLQKFKELTGGVLPDAKKIFRSNEFYKEWTLRTAQPKVNEVHKLYLFAAAILAQTDGKIAIDFFHKPEAVEGGVDADGFQKVGKKRKRAEEKSDDKVTITEKNMHEFVMVPRRVTFAAAATKAVKKTRKQSEYLLHVFKSEDEHLPITRDEFSELEQYITGKVIELALEGSESPLIDWMAYGSVGVGLVAAKDARSMKQLRELIGIYELDGDKFRGWEKEELNVTLSVRLPASLRDEHKYPDETIAAVMKRQNSILLEAEHFSHLETKVVKPKNTPSAYLPEDFRVFKFKVDHITMSKLTAAGGDLHVISAKVPVSKGRTRLVPDDEDN